MKLLSFILVIALCIPTTAYASGEKVTKVKASKGLTDAKVKTKVLKKEGTYQVSLKTSDLNSQLKFKPKKSGVYYFSIGNYHTSPETDLFLSFEIMDKNNCIPEYFEAALPYLGSLQMIHPEEFSGEHYTSINYILEKGKTYYLQFGCVAGSDETEKQMKKQKVKGKFELNISFRE